MYVCLFMVTQISIAFYTQTDFIWCAFKFKPSLYSYILLAIFLVTIVTGPPRFYGVPCGRDGRDGRDYYYQFNVLCLCRYLAPWTNLELSRKTASLFAGMTATMIRKWDTKGQLQGLSENDVVLWSKGMLMLKIYTIARNKLRLYALYGDDRNEFVEICNW